MISVVVNSRNEADKLDKCLNSVSGWADEIVVVDMESNDNTKKVARKYNAKVYTHKRLDYVEPARKFAVSKSSYAWVLILDPDETINGKLKKTLKEIALEDQYSAVNIPRLNNIFGQNIKHTNFWPDRQIRFIKKDKVEFSDYIHSYPKVGGRVLNLEADENLAIHHYPYNSLSDYINRMQRYSNIEAKNRFKNGERFSIINLFYMPAYDFIRRFIRHKGFLDGWNGLILSLFQAYYYILVEIKLFKLKK